MEVPQLAQPKTPLTQNHSALTSALLLWITACLLSATLPTFAQTAMSPVTATPNQAAVPVPTELTPYGANWVPKGTGTLRFFGFKAYDATLWLSGADGAFSFARPFALDIRYATAIKGRDISNTSLIELQRISTSAHRRPSKSWRGPPGWSQYLST